MEEIWLDIKGWEGKYKISNLGRVYSLKSKRNRKPVVDKYGYEKITLGNSCKKHWITTVHKIVALHFCEKRPEATQVNHKNGVKTDNRSDNLEWCTVSENNLHAWRTGLKKPQLGMDASQAKLKDWQVITSRILYEICGMTQAKVSKFMEIRRKTLSDLLKRKSWRHI